jgi:hypothetical protein
MIVKNQRDTEHYLEASSAARLRQDRQLAGCDYAHVRFWH